MASEVDARAQAHENLRCLYQAVVFFRNLTSVGGIYEILALAYAGRVEVNDSLARFYSRRLRGLRRADPYRIRSRQSFERFFRGNRLACCARRRSNHRRLQKAGPSA